MRPRAIVAGQVLGVGVLTAASALAALAAVAVPTRWLALLGLVPLGLGVTKGIAALRARGHEASGTDGLKPVPTTVTTVTAPHGQIVAVAAITLANGADNLAVYVPLFATERAAVPLYAAVFAVLVGVWCFLGRLLVATPGLGDRLRRHGDVVLPVVLVALGVHILWGLHVKG